MIYTKFLLIRFKNPISSYEVEAFRGALINEIKDKDVLFHNHLPDGVGFRYSYPLIQYKRINQKAAILCLEKGTDAIGKLFLDSNFELCLNDNSQKFVIESVNVYKHLIQIWDFRFKYRIRKWLALNQENYEKFDELESMVEKILFLENILKANILSFAKGINVFFEKQIECKIVWLSEPKITRYKNVKMTIFDAEFITNVSIPNYIGLGKGVSIGYGTTVRNKE